MNEKNQTNNQKINQANDERKTVINGKIVPLHQAQASEEQFNNQNNQTGIQAHHDNSSESVQAGQVAQNQNQFAQAHAQENIKAVNVQSGQSHLEGMAGANQETQAQRQAKADHESVQNSVDAKSSAKAKANNKKVD